MMIDPQTKLQHANVQYQYVSFCSIHQVKNWLTGNFAGSPQNSRFWQNMSHQPMSNWDQSSFCLHPNFFRDSLECPPSKTHTHMVLMKSPVVKFCWLCAQKTRCSMYQLCQQFGIATGNVALQQPCYHLVRFPRMVLDFTAFVRWSNCSQ